MVFKSFCVLIRIMFEELKSVGKSLPNLVDSIDIFGKWAINYVKRDMSSWDGRDVDVLVFTKGSGFFTPNIVFEQLAEKIPQIPPTYEPSIYNLNELHKYHLCHLRQDTMRKHLNQFCVKIYGNIAKDDFKIDKDTWKYVSEKTRIGADKLTDASHTIRTTRKDFFEIERKYKTDKIVDSEDCELLANQAIRFLRISVDMATDAELGQHEDDIGVMNAYLKVFPYKKKDKKIMERLADVRFSKLSKEKSLEVVKSYKFLLERAAQITEDYIERKLGF